MDVDLPATPPRLLSRIVCPNKPPKNQTYVLLENLKLLLPFGSKFILPRTPNPLQFLDILLMDAIDLFLLKSRILGHPYRPTNNNIHWSPVRHEAHIIIEDTSRMEEGNSKAQYFLD